MDRAEEHCLQGSEDADGDKSREEGRQKGERDASPRVTAVSMMRCVGVHAPNFPKRESFSQSYQHNPVFVAIQKSSIHERRLFIYVPSRLPTSNFRLPLRLLAAATGSFARDKGGEERRWTVQSCAGVEYAGS